MLASIDSTQPVSFQSSSQSANTYAVFSPTFYTRKTSYAGLILDFAICSIPTAAHTPVTSTRMQKLPMKILKQKPVWVDHTGCLVAGLAL